MAEPGGTVLVCSSNYTEQVDVDVPGLTVRADGEAKVHTLDGWAFRITAPDVTVSGFTTFSPGIGGVEVRGRNASVLYNYIVAAENASDSGTSGTGRVGPAWYPPGVVHPMSHETTGAQGKGIAVYANDTLLDIGPRFGVNVSGKTARVRAFDNRFSDNGFGVGSGAGIRLRRDDWKQADVVIERNVLRGNADFGVHNEEVAFGNDHVVVTQRRTSGAVAVPRAGFATPIPIVSQTATAIQSARAKRPGCRTSTSIPSASTRRVSPRMGPRRRPRHLRARGHRPRLDHPPRLPAGMERRRPLHPLQPPPDHRPAPPAAAVTDPGTVGPPPGRPRKPPLAVTAAT